ncbi:sulfotransferase 2B1-like isoform X1 [Rana temporaria]|uniref:sulfotransferase 2B1-like isoform X1 n=2 Tax=Rana temporaria TaxID=8407 RepID=UPI001AAC71C6|nr:sulfotransferase 2B1-like isoform X1 [Rana temporaria]
MDTEYFQHKGINFASVVYSKERLEYLENEFQVQDDDVYIVTFPKSGTNWMMEILSLIHSNGDISWCQKVPNYVRIPWLDVCGHGVKLVDEYQSPRLFSSHLPMQFFPKSLFSSKAKVIYTARNPKDVLVSLYHYAHMSFVIKKPNSFDEFMEDFLEGRVPFGSWFDHIKGWIQMKDNSNFFFITYEDLKRDHRGAVKKICTFLGHELEEQTIDLVVEQSSFNVMKSNSMSNNSLLPDYIMDPENNNFMRKGINDDWKNHFTQKQNEYMNTVYQDKMKDLNVKFTWDETDSL